MSSTPPKVFTVQATGIETIFSKDPNYAAARAGTGTLEIHSGTQDYACGQAVLATMPLFVVDQLFLKFDTTQLSAALAETGTLQSIVLEIESVAGSFTYGIPGGIMDEFWVALAPWPNLFPTSTSSFVPGSMLPAFTAGRYKVVRAQDYDTNGHLRFKLTMSLDVTAVRTGLLNGGQFVLFPERQRDNQEPLGFYPPDIWTEGIALPGTLDWTNPNNLRIVVTYSPTTIVSTCLSPNATTYNQFNTMALTWTILPGAGVNPNGCSLALYTTPPSRSAEGTRPGVGAYADTDVPDTTITSNTFVLGTPITFPTATADWGDIWYYGLVGRNAGELLLFGPVEAPPVPIKSGDTASVFTNNFTIVCNGATQETNYNIARVLFDRIAPATIWADYGSSPRTMRLGLLRQSGAELVGDTYARQNATFSQVGDYAQNDALVTFPTSTADWEPAHYVGIWDPTGAELRFVVPLNSVRTCLTGMALTIAAGALKVGWI